MSAIPPLGLAFRAPTARAQGHVAILYDRVVVQFLVGLVVGASIVALLTIIIAPSRRVRAEPPLPRDVETRLLLGQDPDQATIPPAPRGEPPVYSPNDLAALRKLSAESQSRSRRKRS